MLSKADRLAFSLSIVSADQQIKGLQGASAQIQTLLDKALALDTANTHLFNPENTLVNSYQAEFNLIDGNVRTSITEPSINDSASKILGNHFFPNNVLLTIPSLSAKNNVWTQIKPFALAFGVGKNYDQSYTSGPSEQTYLTEALALITTAGTYTDIQNTAGQHCVSGTCSLPQYLTEPDCTGGGGTWDPTEAIVTFPEIHTLATNLMNKVIQIGNEAIAESMAIMAIVDSDPTRQSQNAAALNYINTVLIPAFNTWLGYQNFNTAHGQTTCAGFNGYNADLLAPTKLHSSELLALQSVLTARASFLTTRVSQLNTNLGSISQNIDTGLYTGSGFYKTRFDFLNLRLNLMTGSLTDVVNLQQSLVAQSQISSNLVDNRAIYMSILPTTKFAASGNGTAVISLVDAMLYTPGQTVYIASDTQDELVRAIKSINGNSVLLNDIIPTKYTVLDNTRFYTDLT